ncbi:uncharacterized protein LOC124455335, partial [Xenia sp. Carnegie-2017]|uniref:uncharacterized protein LOC124455335 n=1 Tax=Xenia sp. Carnegie-2017 TaxID=2897299 RepID=UPI001F04D6AD
GKPDAFVQGCIDAHNNYRQRHGAPPLTWNVDLQIRAQAWADQMATTGILSHDMKGINKFNDGENIGFNKSEIYKPLCQGVRSPNCYHCSETVDLWYSENQNYDYQRATSTNGRTYLHFTQLEWMETSKMGVGVGVRKVYGLNLKTSFDIYTVVKYSPRGNYGYTDDYLKNVKPERGAQAFMTFIQKTRTPYNFNRDCLATHNTLRAQHGAPLLTWSIELERHAQEWADNLAKRDVLEHDRVGMKKYTEGENIAWLTSERKVCETELSGDCIPCKRIVLSWYNEEGNYDYSKGRAKAQGLPVLHFTQVC